MILIVFSYDDYSTVIIFLHYIIIPRVEQTCSLLLTLIGCWTEGEHCRQLSQYGLQSSERHQGKSRPSSDLLVTTTSKLVLQRSSAERAPGCRWVTWHNDHHFHCLYLSVHL